MKITEDQLIDSSESAGPRDMGPAARRALSGRAPGERAPEPDEVVPQDLKSGPARLEFPGPETESGRPANWTNNPNESGDIVTQGIMMEGGVRGALGLLGAVARPIIASTAGGRARMALDEAGAPVSAPKGEFGQAVKPTGTFNPAATVEGGTFAGMEAGKAIAVLERAKAAAPSSAAADIDAEIARIRASASEMTAADQRIAEAQAALKYRVPGAHEVGMGAAAGAALHYAGHGGLGPLAAAALAAKNATPLMGRVALPLARGAEAAPVAGTAGIGPMSLLLQAAAGAQRNGNQ